MGLFSGLAGVLLTARLNAAVPTAGNLFELDAIAAVVISGIGLSQAYSSYVADLPSAETLEAAFSSTNNQFFQTTKIYDRTGTVLLWEVHGEERRTVVPFEEISRFPTFCRTCFP